MRRYTGIKNVQQSACQIKAWKRDFVTVCCSPVILAWIIVTAGMCQGRPIVKPRMKNMSGSTVSMTVEFLIKYGYLPSSDLSSGNLRTEEELQKAIKAMQKFGNIPQTGIVDDKTLKLIKGRRCGVPDLIGSAERVRRYALQGQKWPSTNITWSVKEPIEKADLSMVRSQLSRAFKVWSDASVLTFSEIRNIKADIVVSFLHGSHGDGYPFDGEGSVLAHAFFPGEGIGGDAHFDAEETWLPQHPVEEEEGVNLFAVAAHEIGHSLGLSHSSTPGSLMFPYYQVVDGRYRLPDDDTNGIQQLYGSKNSKDWATMPKVYPTAISSPTTPRVYSTTPPTKLIPTKSVKGKDRTASTLPPVRETTTHFPSTHPSTEKIQVTPTEEIVPDDLPEPPDACNTSIDAISVIRREVFIFKSKYFWRLNANKTMKKGYPVPISRFWNLPQDLERIDALYERPTDTKIVFFSGKKYWLFAAADLVPGYPRPITDLGLPSRLDHIDAAMVWGHNGKTYFFSGQQYWKFDEIDGTVELDYPKNISVWRGVSDNIDSAFQWTDGNTYFFKDTKYWKFNDVKMKTSSTARDISKFWFGCKVENEKLPSLSDTTTTTQKAVPKDSKFNRANSLSLHVLMLFICVLCNIIFVDSLCFLNLLQMKFVLTQIVCRKFSIYCKDVFLRNFLKEFRLFNKC